MAKQIQVAVDDLKKVLSEEQFNLSTSYILEYFDIAKHLYAKDANIELRIERNKDGSFSIYEGEKGFLIIHIRKAGRGEYIIVPMGVARYISCDILERYNESISRNIVAGSSVYQELFSYNEMADKDRIDLFLFYMGVIVINAYNFNLETSSVKLPKQTTLYIKGRKDEWFFLDNKDLHHGLVMFNVSLYHNKDVIKIIKHYACMQGSKTEDKFELKIEEIIENALNEFRAGQDKKV